jgi:regulator of protease activity HflC (stomatin/prohibitin superfamily)
MITTSISALLLIVGFLSLVAARAVKDEETDSDLRIAQNREVRNIRRGIGAISTIVGFILLSTGIFYRVNATEVGVPVTFGKIGDPVSSGLHVKNPFTEIKTLPVRPFTLPEDIEVSVRTSQGGNVIAKYGARWVVNPEDAANVYLQVRTGDEEKISKDLVEKTLATAVGNVYVSYDNATATIARVQAEASVITEVNRLLSSYGVKVTQVFLRQVDPDEKTKDSLDRLSAAKNETSIAEQKVATAKQEAAAEAARASGAKGATSQIPNNLTPQQITVYCAQLWAKAQQDATERGQSLWTTPCDTGSPVPLVQQAG